MRNVNSIAILISSALILSACQSSNTQQAAPGSGLRPATPTAPAVRSRVELDGVWAPVEASNAGTYTASFSNGQFLTKAADTKAVIGAGKYTIKSNDKVDLFWVGALSKTENNATCVWGQETLNCSATNGFKFTLKKT